MRWCRGEMEEARPTPSLAGRARDLSVLLAAAVAAGGRGARAAGVAVAAQGGDAAAVSIAVAVGEVFRRGQHQAAVARFRLGHGGAGGEGALGDLADQALLVLVGQL